MISNRKPADELADVRDRIRELKGREEELRELFLSGRCDRNGDDYAVTVSTVKAERVDLARLRKELGSQFLAPFMIPTERTTLNLERVKGD